MLLKARGRLPLKEIKLSLGRSWVGEGGRGSQELIVELNLKEKTTTSHIKERACFKQKGKWVGRLWGRHEYARKLNIFREHQ